MSKKKKAPACTHEVLDIISQVVHTSEKGKITGSSLNIKVVCIACGTPFEFMGVASKGYDRNVPTASDNMTVLHIPMRASETATPVMKIVTDKKLVN